MSGMLQLGQFLQTLSNNATQLAQQGLKNAAAGGAPNGGAISPAATPGTPATPGGTATGGPMIPPTPSSGTTPGPNLAGGSTPPVCTDANAERGTHA